MNDRAVYPVGHQFSIGFNPIEDRLVLTTELKEKGPTTLLLTRRMVLLMLSQILNRLPAISGLEQTPANYWQEVLELTHQQAVEQYRQASAKAQNDPADAAGHAGIAGALASKGSSPEASMENRVFLATELTCQQQKERLQVAFKGLSLRDAMLKSAHQVPVLALSLEATHVHQLIQLLVSQTEKANWRLPVNLPWTNAEAGNPTAPSASH